MTITFLQPVDLEQVKVAVKENRQRISLAKVELKEGLGKDFSIKFLEKISEKNNGHYKRIRKRLKGKPLDGLIFNPL